MNIVFTLRFQFQTYQQTNASLIDTWNLLLFVIFSAILQQETCQFFDHDRNNFQLI
jgi:hypothetical protein